MRRMLMWMLPVWAAYQLVLVAPQANEPTHTVTGTMSSPTSSLHLPDFWEFNPRGYFHCVDMLFDNYNIVSEVDKYSIFFRLLANHLGLYSVCLTF